MAKPKHAGQWPLNDILRASCRVAGVGIDDVWAQKKRHGRWVFCYKRRDVAFARELYAAFGHEVAGYSWPWLAAHLNCNHTTLLIAGRRALAYCGWPEWRDSISEILGPVEAAETETMKRPVSAIQ